MQTGNASGEIRHRVLQGQRTPEGLSQGELYFPGVRVSAKKRQEPRRENMDGLPAGYQCIGKEADQASDPRVEPPETNLRQLERAGQAVQSPYQGLDELLQPLLQVSVIPALRSHRSEAGAMGSAQVPQAGGKADTGPRMAEESGQPATAAVRSLARLWESRGTDNGSCMTGDCHVQFCEGCALKRNKFSGLRWPSWQRLASSHVSSLAWAGGNTHCEA